MGLAPTFRWRSEPSFATSSRSAAWTSNMHTESARGRSAFSRGWTRGLGARPMSRLARVRWAPERGVLGTRATEDAGRSAEPLVRSGDVAELLRLCERLQLLQRLVLDLADALARDVERAA